MSRRKAVEVPPNQALHLTAAQSRGRTWCRAAGRGVLAYGQTREEALALVQALALRVLADRVEHGEPLPEAAQAFAVAAPAGG